MKNIDPIRLKPRTHASFHENIVDAEFYEIPAQRTTSFTYASAEISLGNSSSLFYGFDLICTTIKEALATLHQALLSPFIFAHKALTTPFTFIKRTHQFISSRSKTFKLYSFLSTYGLLLSLIWLELVVFYNLYTSVHRMDYLPYIDPLGFFSILVVLYMFLLPFLLNRYAK